MFCQKCGAQKQDNAFFCDQCGAKLVISFPKEQLQWNCYKLFRKGVNIYTTSYPHPKNSAQEVLSLLKINREYEGNHMLFLVSFYPERCRAVPGEHNQLHIQQVEQISQLSWNHTTGEYVIGEQLPIKEIQVGLSG